MSKKIWLIASCFLMVVALLASAVVACAKPAPSPAPAPAPAPAPSPAPAPAQPAKVIKWKVQTFETAVASTMNRNLSDHLEWIKERSGGRLDPTPLLPAGAVTGAYEMFDGAKNGLLDYLPAIPGFYSGSVPFAWVESGLSGAWSNTWELYDIFMRRGLKELAKKAYEPHNLYWLTTWGGADCSLMTNKKINTLADLKGMKIRIAGEPQELLKYYGASIVQVPFEEFYLSLQQGIIDGIGTMPSYMVDMKLGEVVDYLTFPAIKRDSCPMLINMDSWNELPDDLKKMMEDEYTWMPFLFKHAQELDYEQQVVIRTAAKDYGVEVSYLPDSEIEKLRKTAQEITWPWVANMDPMNAEAVKMIEQQMKDVGKL